MALEVIKGINQVLAPHGHRVNSAVEAANLLNRDDVDAKIKELIAPMIINLLALRLPELEEENSYLRTLLQDEINKREIKILDREESRRYEFHLLRNPIGLTLAEAGWPGWPGPGKSKTYLLEKEQFAKMKILIIFANYTFEQAKKKVGYRT